MNRSLSEKTLGIRDGYEHYKKHTNNPVSLAVYLDIVSQFSKYMINLLVDNEYIRLPERVGVMYFGGKKTKPHINKENGNIEGLTPNWKETNKLWKKSPEAKEKKEIIFYFNEHTNGVRYKLFWSKKNVYIRNKDFYSFKLARANKKLFSKKINEGKEFIVEQFN